MFAPRVFVSMIFALSIFAIVTYILNGSAWTTAWQTVVCAVLLQVGYFVAVMANVAKTARDRRMKMHGQAGTISSIADEKDTKTIRVSNTPGHFNS